MKPFNPFTRHSGSLKRKGNLFHWMKSEIVNLFIWKFFEHASFSSSANASSSAITNTSNLYVTYSKSIKFQRGQGSFSTQKFILQILDPHIGLFSDRLKTKSLTTEVRDVRSASLMKFEIIASELMWSGVLQL